MQHQDLSGANTLVQHCANSSVTDPHLYVKVPQPVCRAQKAMQLSAYDDVSSV